MDDAPHDRLKRKGLTLADRAEEAHDGLTALDRAFQLVSDGKSDPESKLSPGDKNLIEALISNLYEKLDDLVDATVQRDSPRLKAVE